jgi:hypothetical protein
MEENDVLHGHTQFEILFQWRFSSFCPSFHPCQDGQGGWQSSRAGAAVSGNRSSKQSKGFFGEERRRDARERLSSRRKNLDLFFFDEKNSASLITWTLSGRAADNVLEEKSRQ